MLVLWAEMFFTYETKKAGDMYGQNGMIRMMGLKRHTGQRTS